MMRMVLTLFMLSGTLLALEWEKDINTALKSAKKENKALMVFVESEHCPWCKKMKHRTIGDEGIEKRLENFVLVKVMREDPKAMKLLPPIQGVPTVFFLTEKKEVLEEVIGYFDVLDFTSYIGDVEKKLNKSDIK